MIIVTPCLMPAPGQPTKSLRRWTRKVATMTGKATFHELWIKTFIKKILQDSVTNIRAILWYSNNSFKYSRASDSLKVRSSLTRYHWCCTKKWSTPPGIALSLSPPLFISLHLLLCTMATESSGISSEESANVQISTDFLFVHGHWIKVQSGCSR